MDSGWQNVVDNNGLVFSIVALGIVFRIRYELDRDAPLNIARVPNLAGARR